MSKIEVNTVEPQCGTTLTLGASGDTVALGSGAAQTGFGRTGTVDWVTTPKTGTVTAVTGKGYFVNTTSGAITVNLPAGAAGSIVGISDYASTANSNNILVEANGAELINADAGTYTISTAGLAVTLVYVDGTRGWKSVTGSDADATGVTPAFIVATGGSPCSGAIVCTNYKVHTFTGPGTLCVSAAGNCAGSNTVDYLVVAGGGGSGSGCSGSSDGGGGGGAGGYRESSGAASGCYTASPLGSGVSALAVSATGYPIAVGGGGPGSTNSTGNRGTDGSTSTFSTIDSAGGGAGGSRKISGGSAPIAPGNPGGSGGGGGSQGGVCGTGGIGNTPPVSPAQGFPGLDRGVPNNQAGAGGGATAVGTIGPSGPTGNTGGAGATTSISATPTAYAGGGGSGATSTGGTGGTGGGGAGTPTSPNVGTVNTGGGGGGGFASTNGGQGGSGIVIIRYKFQ